jgi:hypothetical protein
MCVINKKFWEELISLLSLHKHGSTSQKTLTEFTAVNNAIAMVTVEHNTNRQFNKAYLKTLNLNNFKMVEAMGLQIIASRSP